MKRALAVSLIFGGVTLGAILSFLAFRETISQRGPSSLESSLQVSELAPDFTLKTLEGTVIRLSDLRERKVILNFWASWCAPCRAEMPDFERIYQQYGDRLTILGINIQEDRQTLERFLDEVPVSYPILLDPKGTAVQAYRVIAQPATFWIDEHGRITERKFGAYTPTELEERAQAFVGPSRSVPVTAEDTTLKRGDLGEKYFSQYDLEFLQISGDPSNVAYVADLDLSLLGLGCPARDCIPSIDQPEFETPTEAQGWLKPTDLVVSVTYNGVTKAYPVKILNWHEIVNDDFNGEPLAVTFCPLCNSALVFRRPIVDGKILEFGVSGRLYKSDLVMYDRQTASFWSQIEGRAIIGPLAGTRLEYVPTEMMLWQKWQERYSVAWVLARPTVYTAVGGQPGRSKQVQSQESEEHQASWRGQATRPQIIDPSGATLSQEFLRNYDYDPYSLYKTDDFNTFGTPFGDERLGAKTTIWGLELNGAAKAYLPEAVAQWGALNDELGGKPILVLWDSEHEMIRFFSRRLAERVLHFNYRDGQIIDTETQSLWDADGQAESGPLAGAQLQKLPGIPAFWFAWLAFHPHTELYRSSPSPPSSLPSEGEG
jgi:thiol-disulfide isomerase/thioredoxin